MIDHMWRDFLVRYCSGAVVPFRAEFTCGSLTSRTVDGLLAQEAQGSGLSVMLGRFTVVQRHRLNLASGQISDGSYTLTAANGERIFGRYSAGLDRVPGCQGVLRGRGNWTIEGGSGRFAGARGGGIAMISCLADGASSTMLEGTIDAAGCVEPSSC